jgi:hypothetical protein
MRALSICLMLVGAAWALGVGFMFLVLSGIAEPISFLVTGGYFAGQLIGPFMLIAGPILVQKGKHAKAGAVLVLMGCAVLSAAALWAADGDPYPDPSIGSGSDSSLSAGFRCQGSAAYVEARGDLDSASARIRSISPSCTGRANRKERFSSKRCASVASQPSPTRTNTSAWPRMAS